MTSDSGVTLLELILVMMILGIVVGGGLGLFSALDVGRRQAVGLVKNVLRTAQNSALARTAPACVRIDPENGSLRAEALAVVGTWHFENGALEGAFGLDGGVEGAEFVRGGYLGDALSFQTGDHAVARIPIETEPSFDFHDGFRLECAVRVEGTGGGRLIDVGGSVGLLINAAGAVRGEFLSEILKDGRLQPGGTIAVETGPGLVPPSRWTRLALEYDRERLVLHVDGVPVVEQAEVVAVWKVEAPLTLSDERRPFPGSIDNLVISAMVTDESVELPDSVRFAGETIPCIRFDAGGGLDRRTHPEPVLLWLDYEDGSRESIGVGFYGTVDG